MLPILKHIDTTGMKRIGCVLFILVLLANIIQAQTWSIKDTTQVYQLIDSTHKVKRTDRVLAEKIANDGIRIADEIGDPMARARARLNLSVLNLNKFKAYSKTILHETIAICESANLPRQKASAYNNLGLNYRMEGKLDSALYYHQECLKYALANDLEELVWKSRFGLTRVYKGNNQTKEAEDQLLQAWEYIKEKDIQIAKGMILYHLAGLYFKSNQHKKYAHWLTIWQEYVSSRNKSIDDLITPEHYNMSLFFEDFERTVERFDTVFAYHQGKKDSARMGMTYWDLADTYKKEKQYDNALTAFKNAKPLIDKNMGQFFLVSFYKDYYETAKKGNNIPISLSTFERYQALVSDARRTEMDQRLAELEVKYETNEKEAQIAQGEKEKLLIIGSLGIVGMMASFIIWSLRNRLKIKSQLAFQTSELQAQRIRQLEQEKQLAGYNAMIEGEEQERARIAKDLHDGLGGLLTTVKAHFNALDTNSQLPLYQKTNQLLDDACREVRTISHNMMPHSLMLSGLQGALEDLGASLVAENKVCDIEIINLNPKLLSAIQQTTIYRIVQELIQNISKHSDAKQVLIQLLQHQNELILIVEDDGKGFDSNQKMKGIGLKNIQSRVRYLDGQLDIDTVRGEGTTITMRIPLKQQDSIATNSKT